MRPATLSSEAIRLALQQEQDHEAISEAVSPLRQRMIDDMRMRKLELKTRAATSCSHEACRLPQALARHRER